MKAPHELPVLLAQLQQRHPHQWRLCQIEATLAVGTQERFESRRLVRVAQLTPILLFPRQGCLLPHHLKRFIQALMNKSGSQDGMAIDHSLPRLPKCSNVEVSLNSTARLIDVY